MREGRDSESEMFDALVARLRELPESNPRARAAILARVRGRRQSPWRAMFMGAWHQSAPQLGMAAGIVAAIGLGYAGRLFVEPAPATAIVASDQSATTPVVRVSNNTTESQAVPTTFILKASEASRVALVGDFNGWNRETTLLADPSGNGVWEVTVPLMPGRHTYAFLVNDSVWTVDPRSAPQIDPDFGSPSSVILVMEKR